MHWSGTAGRTSVRPVNRGIRDGCHTACDICHSLLTSIYVRIQILFRCWQQRQHKYLRGTNCPHHKHFTRPQKLRSRQNWKILSLFSVCSLLTHRRLGIMFTHLSTFFAKHLRKQRKSLPTSQMVLSLRWSFWKWTQTTTTNSAQPNPPPHTRPLPTAGGVCRCRGAAKLRAIPGSPSEPGASYTIPNNRGKW